MSTDQRRDLEAEPFELPDTVDLSSVNIAEMEVIRLASQRRLSPLSALRFTRMLDHRRRVIADRDFEERMRRLEKQVADEGDEA